MDTTYKDALRDYFAHRESPRVVLNTDGTYSPSAFDTCPLCEDARWSCGTGAHLKQPEHYALKHGVSVKAFIRIASPMAFGPSNIAWKKVQYVEDSYLISAQNFKWIPETVSYAECGNCNPKEIPGTDCSCGLYFFWSPFSALDYYSNSVLIKCEIGGNIIEATQGCKAQCAVIRGIYYDEDDVVAEKLSRMYNVPLITDLLEDYDVRFIDDL